MTTVSPHSIDDRLYVLRTRWELYQLEGQFEQFIELAVAINSLAEHFNRMRLPGLVRLCEGLENLVLTHLGEPASHPIEQRDQQAIQRQLDALLGAVASDHPGEKLARVAEDLNRAGIPAEVVDDIVAHLWDKVLYNCALNPLGAILSAPYGALGENQQTRELMRMIIAEIYQVARAKGVELQYDDAAAYFRHFLENLVPPTAAHWPSMWQDLQAGRRTEIEALNGAICRYGRETGVATPYNEAVSRLIRFMEERVRSA